MVMHQDLLWNIFHRKMFQSLSYWKEDVEKKERKRERERERECEAEREARRDTNIHVYIYIYIEREREREYNTVKVIILYLLTGIHLILLKALVQYKLLVPYPVI